MRAETLHARAPATVLRNLNTVLLYDHQGRVPRFCTVLFGILTPAGAERLSELVLVCDALRTLLAGATPMLVSDLDPAQADGWAADQPEVDVRTAGLLQTWELATVRLLRERVHLVADGLQRPGDAGRIELGLIVE